MSRRTHWPPRQPFENVLALMFCQLGFSTKLGAARLRQDATFTRALTDQLSFELGK
jgi:hypothetical protein